MVKRAGNHDVRRWLQAKVVTAGAESSNWLAWLMLAALVTAVTSGSGSRAEDPTTVVPSSAAPQPVVPDAGVDLSFIRVQVPPGRLAEVVPGGVQYVPMPATEFEEAVRQFTAPAGSRLIGLPLPAADLVRYELRLDKAGQLAGQVTFAVDVGDGFPNGSPAVTIPVGEIDLRECRWLPAAEDEGERAAEQSSPSAAEQRPRTGSEVDLFGLPDGSVELRVPGPGTVTARVSARPTRGLQPQVQAVPLAGGQPEFSYRVPLVPALSTTILLDLPVGLEPRIPGFRGRSDGSKPTMVAGENRKVWEFSFGPRDAVEITVAAAASPRLFLWSQAHLGRRARELTTVIMPVGVWTSRELTLRSTPQLQLTELSVEPDGGREPLPVELLSVLDGALAIRLPVEVLGRPWPLHLRAALTTQGRKSQSNRLPGITLEDRQWAGGGLAVTVAADLQCIGVDTNGCLPISPGETARWPLPGVFPADAESDSQPPGAAFAFELQQPDSTVDVLVAPQRPELDIARVTTVELTTAAVIGRAACDIRVRRGSVHRLDAIVGDGWFIDSIEPLGQPAGEAAGASPETTPERPAISATRGKAAGSLGTRYEWKVVRERRGDRLILDLPAAVTTDRELRLRITGHRAAIPAGGRFSSADIEMIRMVGEVPGRSWIDLQTSSDTTLQELGGTEEAPPETLPPRLLALSEGKGWRKRMTSGTLTPPRAFQLLRRRPPLDVQAQARFTVRGDQLNETYSFVCKPIQGQLLDAATVHFSEPVGELEWSILAAGNATVFARRLEPIDRSGRESPASTRWPTAVSYRIEVTPPVLGVGTLRATATRPFNAPIPVPLAWVEAAVSATGEAIVQAVGQERPLIENHRLTELPPRERHFDTPLETVGELSYDMQAVGGHRSDSPAAVLVPAPVAARPVARAWVWQERTTVRCFTSAAAEFETTFEIENDGRRSIQLSLPADHRLLGITVGGERMPLLATPTGELPIFLPPGKRRLTLLVRTASNTSPQFGFWRLSTDTPTVDAPTLLREWQLLLPDTLSVAAIAEGYREVGGQQSDWSSRLVGGVARAAEVSRGPLQQAGVDRVFQVRRFVPSGGRYERHSFLLVDRLALVMAAGLAALLVAGVAMQISWRWSWLLLALVALLAVAALWVPQPVDMLLRSGLWAAVAVAILRLRGLTKPVQIAGLLLAAVSLPAQVGAEELPLRVFVTPVEDGLTALVPQPLFRVLAGVEAGAGRTGARLLDCRVEPQARQAWRPGGAPEAWWLNLLFESDAATVLSFDQSPTESRFSALPVRLDGGVVRASVSPDRRRLTLPLPAAGRHTVTLAVEPAWNRRGDLEVAEVRLPVSPQTSLIPPTAEVASPAGSRLHCEWSRDGLVFQPATESRSSDTGQQGYRLPAARLLRLIRPVDIEGTLVSTVPEADSQNRIAWNADGCRLVAEFTIDSGQAILPTVWLQADPRLRPAGNNSADLPAGVAADYELVSVGPGVYRVDRQTPVRGEARFEIPFTMPVAGPVGVVDLPDVWLRGVRVDHREVLLATAADLDFTVRFPGSAAPPLLEDSFAGISWSVDVIETSLESGTSGPRGRRASAENISDMPTLAVQQQPVVLEVTRSATPVRGRQQIEILNGGRDTRLVYEAMIDARATVWVEDRLRIPAGFEIESCQLSEQPETGEAAAVGQPVDLVRTAEPSGSQRLVIQRPRSGRYLLRLEARRGRRLPGTGPVPLVFSELTAGLPYSVIWSDAAAQGSPEFFEAPKAEGRDASQQQPAEAEPIIGVAVEATAGVATWRIDLPVNDAAWSYRTNGPGDRPLLQPRQAGETSPAPTNRSGTRVRLGESQAAVELADIEIVIDERGRLSGIGRFDLMTSQTAVGLRIPEGFRLFELLIDGREVQPAVPGREGPEDVWTIPLRPSPWPREIVAVFAGEVGTEVMGGEPVLFEPPMLTGLPTKRMIWTVDHPSRLSPRVAGAGRTATPGEARRIRRDAGAAIDQLLAGLTPGGSVTAERIERFRGLRQPGLSPLEAWAVVESGPSTASDKGPFIGGLRIDDARWSRLTLLPAPEQPAITLRFVVMAVDESGRTAATLLVFLAGAAGWWSVTRRPGRTFAAASRWWPAVVGLGGIAWLLNREPLWPGILVVAVTAVTLTSRWLHNRRDQRHPQIAAAEAETIEYRRDGPAGASSVTRTAVGQFPQPGR